MELRLELVSHLFSHRVAVRSNGRSDHGDQISRISSVEQLHAANAALDDARDRASPAGVKGGYGTAFWVKEQYGNTIGRLHRQQHAGNIGHKRIAAHGGGWQEALSGFPSVTDRSNDRCVALIKQTETSELSGPQAINKPDSIGSDALWAVMTGEAEVEVAETRGKMRAVAACGPACAR